MKKFIAGCILAGLSFASCEKKVDPIDTSNATVTLDNLGSKYVTDNVTVNPKDSLYFSFTITSNKDMKYVGIQKNPTSQTAFLVRDTLTDANKNSYSAIKKIMADSANGDYLYRIVAHDAAGTYIGHKDIRVTVSSDINVFSFRVLQVPDTTDKVNTCYMSATTGAVYNYNTAAANSGLVDFGMYYDTTGTSTSSASDDLKFCLYSPNAPQSQLSYYDISSWTKNNTIMKKFATSVGTTAPNLWTFAQLNSAASLRTAAALNLTSGTSSKVTTLVKDNTILFKTASGKVGCMLINFVIGSSPAKGSYMNVDVKIEK